MSRDVRIQRDCSATNNLRGHLRLHSLVLPPTRADTLGQVEIDTIIAWHVGLLAGDDEEQYKQTNQEHHESLYAAPSTPSSLSALSAPMDFTVFSTLSAKTDADEKTTLGAFSQPATPASSDAGCHEVAESPAYLSGCPEYVRCVEELPMGNLPLPAYERVTDPVPMSLSKNLLLIGQ
ncbi:unnamed protein product [Penicillium bialowiezense]